MEFKVGKKNYMQENIEMLCQATHFIHNNENILKTLCIIVSEGSYNFWTFYSDISKITFQPKRD